MLNMRQMVSRKAAPAEGRGPSQVPRVGGTVTMSFEQRRRSRLLVSLDDGREAALLLPRGTVLVDGDLLAVEGEDFVVGVRAAAQSLSIARTSDPRLLTRAAYHLGNRHVPVEIGPGWIAFEHDHVLDGMVRDLGLTVDTRVAPFEPEGGGYRHEHAPAGDTGHSHHV
jgi:urease accessory protein